MTDPKAFKVVLDAIFDSCYALIERNVCQEMKVDEDRAGYIIEHVKSQLFQSLFNRIHQDERELAEVMR